MTLDMVPSLERSGVLSYVELFDRCFSGDAKLSAAYLDWQYLQNPDGRVIGTDAMDGERLAAHYSVIPRTFQFAGEQIAGALSVNTATDPEYQGRGLFVCLAEETYAAAARQGVRFIIGVANANSVGAFARRLGFTVLGHVRLGVSHRPIPESSGALTTLRSAAWWAWRLRNPSRYYAMAGTSLQTEIGGIPFNVATMGPAGPFQTVRRRSAVRERLALTPIFPWASGRTALPLRLQPSPWHVIIRALDGRPVQEYARALTLWGIDMDTF